MTHAVGSAWLFFRYVIANDLSPAAVDAIRRNVELNELGPKGKDAEGKVRVNEGDAW